MTDWQVYFIGTIEPCLYSDTYAAGGQYDTTAQMLQLPPAQYRIPDITNTTLKAIDAVR